MPNIYDDKKIYAGVLEAQVIKQAMGKLQGLFFYELEKLKSNQYLQTADEQGIAEAEAMFNIVPNMVTESLEFRRQRVINRNTTKPPYTYRYLQRKLDEIFGAGNYTMRRDLSARTVYVESSVESSLWYNEVSVTVNKLKPANLVYINSPYIRGGIDIEEAVEYMHRAYNYKLGTKWRLGRKPFMLFEGGGTVKMPGVKSITDTYLNSIAVFSVAEVAKVRINGNLIITAITRADVGNEGTIEYLVTNAQAAEITKIELLNTAAEVLDVSTVYIPVTDPVQVKHKFIIKEGA